MFISVVTIVHIFVCCVLVGIILLQQGKGADVGAAFGGGGSTSLFGAGGADNFLLRLTTICAVIFMATSITLALQSKIQVEESGRLFRDAPATVVVPQTPPAPTSAAPATGTAPAVTGGEAKPATPVEATGVVVPPSDSVSATVPATDSAPVVPVSPEAATPGAAATN